MSVAGIVVDDANVSAITLNADGNTLTVGIGGITVEQRGRRGHPR